MSTAFEPAQFLNVDLDLDGAGAALLDELDAALFTLHRDGEVGHYEVPGCARTPSSAIAELIAVIERLSPAARAAWDAARVRDFNVGIQAPADGQPLELSIDPDAVRAIAALGGRVVITTYPPCPTSARRALRPAARPPRRGRPGGSRSRASGTRRR